MNTVAYSAGRVCYPTKDDACAGDHRDHNGWSRKSWWPPALVGREWRTRTSGVAKVTWTAPPPHTYCAAPAAPDKDTPEPAQLLVQDRSFRVVDNDGEIARIVRRENGDR